MNAVRAPEIAQVVSGAPCGARRTGRLAAHLITAGWFVCVAAVFGALGAAWAAGWRLENVQSASMAPVIPKGSLAVVAPANPREIEAGDVISFFDPGDRKARILHRVAEVIDRGAEGRFFRTQGDANATADALLVPAPLVEGGLRWHFPRLGSIAWMLRPPVGLATLVAVSAAVSLLGGGSRRRREPRASDSVQVQPVIQPRARLTEQQLRTLCSASWDRYFIHVATRTGGDRTTSESLAHSWRDYYVDLVPRRTIDVRDRTIDLEAGTRDTISKSDATN